MLRRSSATNNNAAAAGSAADNNGAAGMGREMVVAVGVRRDDTVVSAKECQTVRPFGCLLMVL